MSENIQTIFNMLRIEPNQRFKIKYDYETYNDYYYIDENLKFQIDKEGYSTSLTTLDVIKGDVEIIYTPVFSEKEQMILNMLFEFGYHYIARDPDRGNTLYAYETLPKKQAHNYWDTDNSCDHVKIIEYDEKLFKNIKSNDDNPFIIDEYVKKDKKYEKDKKKIEEKIIEIYYKTDRTCDNLTCAECPYEKCNHIMCDKAMFIDELIENNFTFLKSEE